MIFPGSGHPQTGDPVCTKAALITPPLRGSRQAKGVSPQARRWGGNQNTATPFKRYKKPEPSAKPEPTPRVSSGTTCATSNWTATNFAANSP